MKKYFFIVLYCFLFLSTLSPSYSAKHTFEVNEEDFSPYHMPSDIEKDLKEVSSQFITSILIKDSGKKKSAKSKSELEKLEKLADAGDKLSLELLWETTQRPSQETTENNRAKFVKDLLQRHVEVQALEHIGTLEMKYSFERPSFLNILNSYIDNDPKPLMLRFKLHIAQSLAHMVSEHPEVEKKHKSLFQAWSLLNQAQSTFNLTLNNNNSQSSHFIEDENYVRRAYHLLFTSALKNNFLDLFDLYIKLLLAKGENSPFFEGFAAFYTVLKDHPYLQEIKRKYDVDFHVSAAHNNDEN